jgi:hypothetical protein
MKLLTTLAATLTLVMVPAWIAQADSAKDKDLQKLLTTKSCESCDLRGVSLIGVDLSSVSLINADLSGAQLQGSKLNAANFSGADLSGANLTEVSAVGTSFVGANLQKTMLTKASLVYTNLAKAQLNDAILQKTDLQGANLVGVDLTGAKITESDFYGANLAEIKGSRSWLTSGKNRFQGNVGVLINQSTTVVSPPSYPTTAPGNGNPGTVQNSTQSTTVESGGRDIPVTRGGRVGNSSRRRRPVPAWIGEAKTTTAGSYRYHDPQNPESILELW